jgi:hypothetical protein
MTVRCWLPSHDSSRIWLDLRREPPQSWKCSRLGASLEGTLLQHAIGQREHVDGRTVLQQARLGAAIALHCASSTMRPRIIEVHPCRADHRESRTPGELEPFDIT